MKPEHEALMKRALQHGGKTYAKEDYLKPNEMVGKILVTRFLHMTPEQQQSLKSVLTPQTAEALKILLPELKNAIEKGASNAAG